MAHLLLSPTDIDVLAKLAYDRTLYDLYGVISLPGDDFTHLCLTSIPDYEVKLQTVEMSITKAQVKQLLEDIMRYGLSSEDTIETCMMIDIPIIKRHLLASTHNYVCLEAIENGENYSKLFNLRHHEGVYFPSKMYRCNGQTDLKDVITISRALTDYPGGESPLGVCPVSTSVH